MKAIISTIFFILLAGQFKGQAQTITVENHLLKVNGLVPGLSYEARLAARRTFHTEAGFTITSIGYSSLYGSVTDFRFFLSAGLRQYYNFAKREGKGKTITGNSGNYVGLRVLAYGEDLDTEAPKYIVPGLVWGLQRTYALRWNLGVELGIGYLLQNNQNYPTLISSFRVGYRLK